MTTLDPLTPWDDPVWSEKADTPWAAGCRLLQGWWRSSQPDGTTLPAGESVAVGSRPTRLVTSMLRPQDAAANLLTAGAARARDEWTKAGAGLVSPDRFDRNLLSSQPLAFNLFGPLVDRPNELLGWVQTIDPDATQVTAVRLEWAPPRAGGSRGGSAFDAAVEYGASDARRFLGIECKYAENLAQSSIPSILDHRRKDGSRPETYERYEAETSDDAGWRSGAATALDDKRLRQFWLNTLLVQRTVREFDAALGLVLSCSADAKARAATDDVRAQLTRPDEWLRWSSYEDVVAAIPAEPWVGEFTRRYLDFTPVRHLLEDRGITEGR